MDDGYSPELITLLIALVNAVAAVIVAWARSLGKDSKHKFDVD